MGVLKHFALGVLGHIELRGIEKCLAQKSQTRKIDKIQKNVELHQVFKYNNLCQTVLIFLKYILFTKIIKTFWSRDITSIWVLTHFELKIHNDI